MTNRNIEAIYHLSPMQEGMLFHSVYDPESRLYFEQMSFTIRGELNQDAFVEAWREIFRRHSALRTVFAWKSLEQMLQIVHRQVTLPMEIQDWRDIPADEQERKLKNYLLEDRKKGFDPSKAPLIRLALLRKSNDAYYFVESHHHALLDGWSLPILFKELLTLYESYQSGNEIYLEPARPFKDYINWLDKQDKKASEKYWREVLKGFSAPTPLVVDRIKLHRQSAKQSVSNGAKNEIGDCSILLPKSVSSLLLELTRDQKVTINTLVLAAWAILLSRYSGEESVLLGATVSGRPPELAGVENMVGLFINTLPVRVQISPEVQVSYLLKSLQEQLVEMRQYEYSSLVDIQEWSDVPRGKNLFESILIFENYPVDQSLRQQSSSLKIEDIHTVEQTNYPINVISASGEQIPLRIVYDPQRFDENTVQRMLGHLRTILENIAADPNMPLYTLPLLTEAERQFMLYEWNQTYKDFPSDSCAHELFEAQVEKVPENIAVIFEGQYLTYRQLDQRANQLASYLHELGVSSEQIVGISCKRSLEMIIGILGVLKAGGAYLPLDPTYPSERLAFMMEDSKIRVLLTQDELVEKLPLKSLEQKPVIVRLDKDWDEMISSQSKYKPEINISSQHLAYMIYTSGSTGLPKGTMLQHQGLCNLATELKRTLKIDERKKILQFSALSFDASVWETFMALANGATLCLAEQEKLASGVDLTNLLREEKITNVTLPPSMLRVLPEKELPDLSTLVSAGEACTPDIVERWSPGRVFYNAYGPTESTVCASWYLCDDYEELPPPIGKPIANTKLYILDPYLNPVPIGVAGELFISGVALARCYLNRPEMTALKFIPNPFSDDPSSKLYRTGDLVRYREDGNIEFLGRIDTQVKIRGYRIELGEIEAILQMHPAIRQNAVVVWDDNTGDKFMVAYLEPEEGKGIEIRDVRNFLADKLPGYMIPSSFVIMDILPLLPNGKVDRKALQPPEGGRSHSEAKYVPPRSPVESMLTEIWEQVLGIKRVGVYDNFFELGGHSLLATKVISRIRNVMKVEVPIRDLFENPTVASLSNRVEIVLKKDSGLEMPPLEPLPRNPDTGIPDGDLLPSFSQQRLWFLDQLAPGNLFYNLPMAVKLEGNLDVSALEYSLNEIVRRHASLRTTFKAKDGKPIQAITPEWVIELPVDDLTSMTNEEREQSVSQAIMSEAQRPFNLETGPLMRVRLLKLNNKNDEKQEAYVFVLVMHHIISDGWSMGVFINELAALYSAYTANMSIKLPELRIQYYDFAAWQQEWLQGDVLEKQLDYWRKQLANQPKLLSLPTDHPRPPIQTSRGDIEKFNLPADLSEKVKQLSRKENVTLFMFLLAVYQILLSRYSGQDDISVGTAIAGRNMTDTEALIGFFVNTLVMRTDLSGQPNFREVLKRVREVTLGAFAHQDMPFEILVEQLQPERDLSHTPLFQVAFALQNIPTDERLKGVTDPTATIFDKSSEENDQSVLLELSDVELKQIDINSGTSKFDITLSMAEGDDGLLGAIEYNLDLFEPETIRRLIGHFRTLIEGIVDNPNLAIDLIPILTQEEKDQILEEWNKTLIETPINQCAHQRFEIHAKKTPHKVAVLLDDESISYGDLNRRANQLAHFLINLGVKREDLIGISTKRSLEMVVGILGVMKAGCAYLPIDPTYPPDRIAFMIQDSGISVLLTQGKIVEHLPLDKIDNVPELVLLDDQWESDLAIQPDTTPDVTVLPENLAYVIYTSGSTGLPKGTMLRHNGLCNLAEAQRLAFHIDENSRILQFAPLSFDASVWETFMALANGATLCLARQEVLSSGIEMARYMQEKSITNVTLPPSVLRVLPNEELSNLETVIAAGEACTPELVQQWAHGRDFFNAYGPTETTVCASMHLCSVDEKDAPPIGKPIANTKLYILDENMLPCPVGVPGELHVSGVSVARGYLRRPAMTAQKFVPNPFSNVPGDRLYKTGDLVRYRDNGDIEFLGRIDHQVKVRGFRIELGEIEAALNEYSGIKEGVVLAYEVKPNETRLVAYLVSSEVSVGQNKQELDIGAVKSFLRKLLPDYMIPSYFIILDEMPYSPSGKVDKKQLPPPGKDRSSLRNVYVAPSNDIERELVEISAELLGVERVGVNDNFFELGGHSLLATQFISRVRESLEVELELRQLFETPTVAEIAKVIENTRSQITDDRSRISELIQRINELSDEEVAELLELKRKSKKIQESN